jgi:hypothetical protein
MVHGRAVATVQRGTPALTIIAAVLAGLIGADIVFIGLHAFLSAAVRGRLRHSRATHRGRDLPSVAGRSARSEAEDERPGRASSSGHP